MDDRTQAWDGSFSRDEGVGADRSPGTIPPQGNHCQALREALHGCSHVGWLFYEETHIFCLSDSHPIWDGQTAAVGARLDRNLSCFILQHCNAFR